MAYRQACLNAIEYLKKFGYSGAQAYSILGTAPVQGHISGVVDVPNACATLWLPTQIFDFDINPSAAGPVKYLDGSIDMPLVARRGLKGELHHAHLRLRLQRLRGLRRLSQHGERNEPAACPGCGQAASRVFASAPRLALLDGGTRLRHGHQRAGAPRAQELA